MGLYKLWDKKETLHTFTGESLTAEQVLERYPWVGNPKAELIICNADITLGRADSLNDLRRLYETQGMIVEENATPQDVLDCIEKWEMRVVETPPTAEERIAAAMEFQNLMNY